MSFPGGDFSISSSSAGSESFVDRHVGPRANDVEEMLSQLECDSLTALAERAVPISVRDTTPLDLPDACSESSALEQLSELASLNRVCTSLIGMGYSGTVTPPVILRNVFENPAWYTAYTPYQPEISQGRLEALVNFQTMVCDLTGMDVANASLLDEGTAAAEAMALAQRIGRSPSTAFFVDADCHPQTIAVLRTRALPQGIEIIEGNPEDLALDGEGPGVFGAIVQYPGSSGALHDRRHLIAGLRAQGVPVIVATDLLALTLVTPPGEHGADIVVGSAQRFGVPMGFGGPHAAFIATRQEHVRNLPGRIVGWSVDTAGRPALRLALQTREQHIRREKATSNICTAQSLLAAMAGFYAAYHGPDGLHEIGRRVHQLAVVLAAGLRRGGIEVVHDAFFDTVTVRVPNRARSIADAALDHNVNLRIVDADTLGISLDETITRATVEAVWISFGIDVVVDQDFDDLDELGEAGTSDAIPTSLQRTSTFLTDPVFNRYHSETEMLRYVRRLSDRDLALDRTMIPLGSCTMKLNATTEMQAVSWSAFAALHPFAPVDQARGYLRLFADLEAWLCEITGYDVCSLQPNAGSQGELAGLLAIGAYHRSRGETDRDVCLIPSSAHGTNAASASMAGMRVIVVACDDNGNIDLDDLKTKANDHAPALGALMVTYPSTHGVFEEQIRDVCDVVHECGGQVYLDGANLNALVGLVKPGAIGADVSHINLHKTFCIPHGGGGPGVGPVVAGAHLAPFLPGHPLQSELDPNPNPNPDQPNTGKELGAGPVASAPWGSAGILPISWAYIRLMGGPGLTHATHVAILNANYIASRLDPHYPVLYRGAHGLVAHECILDLRPITDATGVTVDDVAKRLIDYGFHAPTMSFPVAGTLMVEPTESESKEELDRFCDAMIAIRAEIGRIEEGEWSVTESPLRGAPHMAGDVATDNWSRRYSRDEAAFPVDALRNDKYWPPVGRVDNAFGDRNVFCCATQSQTEIEGPATESQVAANV